MLLRIDVGDLSISVHGNFSPLTLKYIHLYLHGIPLCGCFIICLIRSLLMLFMLNKLVHVILCMFRINRNQWYCWRNSNVFEYIYNFQKYCPLAFRDEGFTSLGLDKKHLSPFPHSLARRLLSTWIFFKLNSIFLVTLICTFLIMLLFFTFQSLFCFFFSCNLF